MLSSSPYNKLIFQLELDGKDWSAIKSAKVEVTRMLNAVEVAGQQVFTGFLNQATQSVLVSLGNFGVVPGNYEAVAALTFKDDGDDTPPTYPTEPYKFEIKSVSRLKDSK